ncbi:MAG TPA: hypothetical protein VLE43_13505 [Candidatus Saccharimonadia bacterium]|nr:hypothetical protein [Candidatus Saccharimonadia bacterium]
MMSRLCIALLLSGLVVFSSGCGLAKRGLAKIGRPKKGQNEERKDVVKDTYVGVIESVNPEQQFVLVRLDQRLAIAAGTQLETRTASGLRAKLVAGPERKLNFLAADIVDGVPHAGDVVVLPAGTGVPGTTPPGTTPATPSTPGKLEPILTAEPPPNTLPQPGAFSSPMPPAGGPSYTVPGAPGADPVPGVPPVGYPSSAPRAR